MKYDLKILDELFWAFTIAFLTFVGQAANDASLIQVLEDPQAWVATVIAGAVRFAGGAVLSRLRKEASDVEG